MTNLSKHFMVVSSECYWAIVIPFSYLCLLGYRNDVGDLESCGDSRLG